MVAPGGGAMLGGGGPGGVVGGGGEVGAEASSITIFITRSITGIRRFSTRSLSCGSSFS